MQYVVLVGGGHSQTGLDRVSPRAAEQEDPDVLATGVRGVGNGRGGGGGGREQGSRGTQQYNSGMTASGLDEKGLGRVQRGGEGGEGGKEEGEVEKEGG